MKNQLQLSADKAAVQKIAEEWSRGLRMAEQVEQRQIAAVNCFREVGLALQEISQHKQIRMAFFYELQTKLPPTADIKKLDFSAAQKCVHLANNLPEPVATLEQAQVAMQTVFMAGGFIELKERSAVQSSHDSTPVSFIWNTLSSAKARIEKRIEDMDGWDDTTRTSVASELDRAAEWIADLRRRLNTL